MRAGVVFLGFSMVFWSVAGCQKNVEKPLATYPVEGKVVHSDGKPFTTGGAIEFRHETKDGATSFSPLKPDGTFSLYTMTAQNKVGGAQEGPHIVTIFPPTDDRTVPPVVLQKKYDVAAGANNLTVNIDD